MSKPLKKRNTLGKARRGTGRHRKALAGTERDGKTEGLQGSRGDGKNATKRDTQKTCETRKCTEGLKSNEIEEKT